MSEIKITMPDGVNGEDIVAEIRRYQQRYATSTPKSRDPETLRRAAGILRERSTKRRSLWLAVLLRVLNDTADKIEGEA